MKSFSALVRALGRPAHTFTLVVLAVGALVGVPVQAQTVVTDCSEIALQQALSDAWAAGDGLVTFAEDCSITLSGPLVITQDTTIDAQGHNVTLSGGSLVRVFNVQPVGSAAKLTLIGLTITGGRSAGGGALYINALATVLLTNCTLSGNSARGLNGYNGGDGLSNTNGDGNNGSFGSAGAPALGGAIYNLGNLTLLNCSLTTNSVIAGNGGNGGNGGDGETRFSTFHGGNGGDGGAGGLAGGGAIYNLGALRLSDCTVSGNTVTGGNAGVGGANGAGYTFSYAGSGGMGGLAGGAGIFSQRAVVVSGCTFSGNTAQGGDSAAAGSASNDGPDGAAGGSSLGGAVFCQGIGEFTNCTLYTNTVTGGTGGRGGDGISTFTTGGDGGDGGTASGGGLYGVGTVLMVNCTVANCSAIGGTNGTAGNGHFAGSSGSPGAANGGGIANGGGAFVLRNSIISANAGGNGYGTITDGGYDLSSDSSLQLGPTSLVNTDPRLLAPANNGGPTLTMALAVGSPAVDAIRGAAALALTPRTDQRGVPRPLGRGADIGAFELALAPFITTQPQSQIHTNGDTATFTVAAAGIAPFTYYWRFTGTTVFYGGGIFQSSNTNLAPSSAATLQVLNVSITNAGNYSVLVSNRFGTALSSNALLSVLPYIVAEPTNTEVGPNQHATFSVTAAASQPLTYVWFRDETNQVAAGPSPSYTLPGAQATDDGATFNVVVTNALGAVTSTVAVLRVDAAPVILSGPSPTQQVVTNGASFSFQVTAAGFQPLFYQWRVNGNNLVTSPLMPDSGTFTAQTNYQGRWDVVITNAWGAVTSPPAFLTVIGAPPTSVVATPASQVVTQGQAAAFVASAAGDGLSYQWRLNGTPLLGATSSNLTFSHAQSSQAGNYDVVVANLLGSITSAAASLSVVLPDLSLTNFGSLHVPGYQASGVAVSGNHAFLAMVNTNDGTGRLQAVDIGDPQNPQTNGFATLSGPALSVVVSGPTAYVACGAAGLQVVNVTDPANPVAGTTWGNDAQDVDAAGQYAFVAAGTNGLQVFDFGPTANARYHGGGAYAGYSSIQQRPVSVSVDVAPLSNVDDLVVMDAALVTVTNFSMANAVRISGRYAYVADSLTGLNVIDVTIPASPRWVTNCATGSPVRALDLAPGGNFVYAAVDAGLEAIDISNPAHPVVVGTSTASAPAKGIAYADSYVFLASGTNGLRAFNVTNAASPQLVGANSTMSSANGLEVSGRYVYVAADDGLVILDAGLALETGPQILGQPQGLAIAPGTSGVLSVTVDGTAPLSFQWRAGGLPLADRTNASGSIITGSATPNLMISKAQVSDATNYDVVISNSGGTVTSAVAQVTIACTYQLNPDAVALSAAASTNSFLVTAIGSCSWAATNSDGWIHILSGSGAGSGMVLYGVDANSDANPRVGSISVDGSLVSITQSGVRTLTVNAMGLASGVTIAVNPSDNNGKANGVTPFARTNDDGAAVTLSAQFTVGQNIFQTWWIDGEYATNDAILHVVMNTNHTVTAVYAPLFVNGTYRGLLYDTNGAAPSSSGSFTIVSTPKGAFSGSLQIGLTHYPVSGRFDPSGAGKATNTVARRNPSSVAVELQIERLDTSYLSGRVTLTTTNGTESAELVGDRAYFDGQKRVALQHGRYTMVIPGDNQGAAQPGGDSFGAVIVGPAGLILMAGSLADGTKISQSAILTKDGLWPFYVPLYGGQGFLLSWLALTNPPAGDLNDLGGLAWMKPPVAKARYYAGGITLGTNVLGSHYTAPARGQRVLNLTNADIVLSGGNLSEPLTNHVMLGANSKVTSTNNATLTFNLACGAFSGRVLDADKKPIAFSGVVLTNLNEGHGYFLGTNASGTVLFLGR